VGAELDRRLVLVLEDSRRSGREVEELGLGVPVQAGAFRRPIDEADLVDLVGLEGEQDLEHLVLLVRS
jgi:hypothetical protein